MPDTKVLGRNVLAEIEIASVFYPIFCAKNVSFVLEQDEIETTHINSGPYREYVPGVANSTLQCSGITTTDNTNGRISIFYLMQTSVRRTIHSMRLKCTNQDGGIKIISFNAFVRNTSISGDRTVFSQSDITFRVTGGLTFSDVIPTPEEPVCELADPLYLTMAEGETSVQDNLLISPDITILEVQREGLGYDQTNGSPGNRQFNYDETTGTISFRPSNPALAGGETIYVLYKQIT